MTDTPTQTHDERRANVISGDLGKTIFWLALPVLLEQFLNFCVGFYDTYLSGHLQSAASAEATSAVGLAAYVGWLATLLYAMVATGTTALVARHWGAREYEQANRVANQSITLVAMMSGIVCVVFISLAPVFARLVNLPESAAPVAIRYMRLDAIGLTFTGLSFVGAAALRGAGDMRSPMFIFGWVSVLNVIASTALVYGWGPIPAIGIDGIVGGTIVARVSGGLLMLAGLARGLSGLRLSMQQMHVERETAARLLRIGGPAAVEGLLMWSGHFAFLRIITALGNTGTDNSILAAHIVGIRVEAISYLPAGAWGIAAATVVGQSLGAGDPQRALRAGKVAGRQCGLMGAAISVLFFVFAEGIFRAMHNDPRVWEAGIAAFRMLAFFQWPLMVSIVFFSALRGAGDTRFPVLVTVLGLLAVRLPAAYLFGVLLDGGLFGAWVGMCGDMFLRWVMATVRYYRGRWLGTVV